MRKGTVILLVTCLVVSSLSVLAVPFVSAQAGYKPSVPQFTVKLVDNSYDVPPSTTTTVNPYTGEKNTITTPSYHVTNRTIEVKVPNQSFTQYRDESGYLCDLYYYVQVKGHFGGEQDWHTLYCNVGGLGYDQGNYIDVASQHFTIWMSPNLSPLYSLNSGLYASMMIPGNQLDFRAKTEIAYYGKSLGSDIPGYDMGMYAPREFVVVASSGWSNIQSITIPNGSSPSQTATFPSITSDGSNSLSQSPDQTQPPNSIFSNPLFIFGVGALFAGVVIAVVLVVLRRHLKASTYPNVFSPQANTSNMRCMYA